VITLWRVAALIILLGLQWIRDATVAYIGTPGAIKTRFRVSIVRTLLVMKSVLGNINNHPLSSAFRNFMPEEDLFDSPSKIIINRVSAKLYKMGTEIQNCVARETSTAMPSSTIPPVI